MAGRQDPARRRRSGARLIPKRLCAPQTGGNRAALIDRAAQAYAQVAVVIAIVVIFCLARTDQGVHLVNKENDFTGCLGHLR